MDSDEFRSLAIRVLRGRVRLDVALAKLSTSQQCMLALIGREPGAAPEPYASAVAAWGRLNGAQQAFVRDLVSTAVLREMGIEVAEAEAEEKEEDDMPSGPKI